MTTTLFEATDIRRSFGAVRALDGVSLAIAEGEILGLIGPNGSGKTTMFNCVTGFLRPSSGSVRWRGKDIGSWTPSKIARAGMVRTFQHVTLFEELNLRESVIRAAACGRMNKSGWAGNPSLPEDPDEILGLVGLDRDVRRQVDVLSYGEGRLLGVAMALAVRPWLLLMDEPAAGLSFEEAAHMSGVLKGLRELGTVPFVIDHNMPFMQSICDRVLVIDAGKNLADGPPSEVAKDPRVLEVYLGTRDVGLGADADGPLTQTEV